MESIRRKSSILALACSASLLVAVVASATTPDKPAKPQLSGLKARIAQGGKVDLAASGLTTAELARLRPDYEKLKPRARTNRD
ncbi:MAG: hypothetical protein OEW88_04465 [Gammaproteobacteria bacterium]|nr:hypothetical protein [Gammaproteobacteria bacterium]MDH5275658.1 hypothetical protein [Gammaproteobacteria bacterium]